VDLCKCGVGRYKTILYTSQHNGVAKRMRMLMEKVSMLSGIGLGHKF
jgi:hypothetical protein